MLVPVSLVVLTCRVCSAQMTSYSYTRTASGTHPPSCHLPPSVLPLLSQRLVHRRPRAEAACQRHQTARADDSAWYAERLVGAIAQAASALCSLECCRSLAGSCDFFTRERVVERGDVLLEGRAWAGEADIVRVRSSRCESPCCHARAVVASDRNALNWSGGGERGRRAFVVGGQARRQDGQVRLAPVVLQVTAVLALLPLGLAHWRSIGSAVAVGTRRSRALTCCACAPQTTRIACSPFRSP